MVFLLTRSGRVETTNYRTVMLPTGVDPPLFVRDEFSDFYEAMFAEQHRQARAAVFTEYVRNMGWCDPCAENPLTPDELRKLGVFWLAAPTADAAVGRPWPSASGTSARPSRSPRSPDGIAAIPGKMDLGRGGAPAPEPWWARLWR